MNVIANETKYGEMNSEFYNRSIRSLLRDNNTEMYSTHNEGNFADVESFIRTLKNKIYFNVQKCGY